MVDTEEMAALRRRDPRRYFVRLIDLSIEGKIHQMYVLGRIREGLWQWCQREPDLDLGGWITAFEDEEGEDGGRD